MPRWEPDSSGRLLRAALDLFAERGYDATTAVQIAERAGLTKTTLFRLFADKREILFQGQSASIATLVSAIEAVPQGTAPVDALVAGLLALCATHVPEQQEIGRQVERLVASSPELHERAIFKRASIAEALERSLADRTGDHRLAGILADVGIRAYYQGFTLWTDSRRDEGLAQLVGSELEALLDSLTHIGPPASS